MPSIGDTPSGPTYWRSLEELAATPEFQEQIHNEFPAGATERLTSERRAFLQIMGASLALAGIASKAFGLRGESLTPPAPSRALFGSTSAPLRLPEWVFGRFQ